MNLDEFIASGQRNAWLIEPGLTYYVRADAFFKGLIHLANCEALPGKPFGYWRFYKRYAHRVPFFVENVFNDGIVDFYRARGWREVRDIADIPSFYSPLADSMFPLLALRRRG